MRNTFTEEDNMSVTLHYSQIREPDLLDVVDDAWAQDKLPNDGT